MRLLRIVLALMVVAACSNAAEPPERRADALDETKWREVVDQRAGNADWTVGLATDDASLDMLWAGVGLIDATPEIDFADEVVVYFGTAVGSSCPMSKLDHVVNTGDEVFAVIYNPENQKECTDDFIPYAHVVAIERDALPAGPFTLQVFEWVNGSEQIGVTTDLTARSAVQNGPVLSTPK